MNINPLNGIHVGVERRKVFFAQKAETAAGVGQPDGEDHETGERDADGRCPWPQPDAPAQDETGHQLDLNG